MKRTRFSGLFSATAVLLTLGLAVPAVAQSTPTPEPSGIESTSTPGDTNVEQSPAPADPSDVTSDPSSPAPGAETGDEAPPAPEAPAQVEEEVTNPAPRARVAPAPQVQAAPAAVDTGGFPQIDAYAAAHPAIGDPTGPTVVSYGDGRMRPFENATVYWRSSTGAFAVTGAILTSFKAKPRNLELFGYPIADETTLPNGAKYQRFSNSEFYYSAATGARSVQGAIRGAYKYAGAHGGSLGIPTSDEVAVTGGVQQSYQGGVIMWSSRTGARHVLTTFNTVYRNHGGPAYFGLPTSYQTTLSSGRQVQYFERGAVTSKNGLTLSVGGAIHSVWKREGGAKGLLGLPITGEQTIGTKRVIQQFEGGFIVWHNNRAYSITGAIRTVWERSGGVHSLNGLPTSAEIRYADRKVVQYYQRGAIVWANNRTYAVSGGIGDYWRRMGGVNSKFGAPTSAEINLGGGKIVQQFEGGPITWLNGIISNYSVSGGIGSYWNANGGMSGRFGAPTSGEICNNAGCYQNFVGGSITWGPTTGAHDMYKLDPRCTYGRAVCADKTTNKLYWVVDGKIRGTWDARFGAPGWETTNGEMPIIRKIYNDWSVPFSAWMPFSQYFTNSGMAIHYSSSFEAQGFPSWGSHGCINMNDYAGAEWLYNQTRLGDRVVVYYS